MVKYSMTSDPLSSTLSALADPTRRGILARLAQGDASVTELAAPYDMSSAQWRPCHLEAKPLAAVAAWTEDFRRFWDRNLDSLGDYLATLQKTKAGRKAPAKPRRRRR
jgi:hypothetical protein